MLTMPFFSACAHLGSDPFVFVAGDGHHIWPVGRLHDDSGDVGAGDVEGGGTVLVRALDAGAPVLIGALAVAVHTFLQCKNQEAGLVIWVTDKQTSRPSSSKSWWTYKQRNQLFRNLQLSDVMWLVSFLFIGLTEPIIPHTHTHTLSSQSISLILPSPSFFSISSYWQITPRVVVVRHRDDQYKIKILY